MHCQLFYSWNPHVSSFSSTDSRKHKLLFFFLFAHILPFCANAYITYKIFSAECLLALFPGDIQIKENRHKITTWIMHTCICALKKKSWNTNCTFSNIVFLKPKMLTYFPIIVLGVSCVLPICYLLTKHNLRWDHLWPGSLAEMHVCKQARHLSCTRENYLKFGTF